MTTRTASTVAYLTQNLLQSIAGAQHEYIETYGEQAWREQLADNLFTIRSPKHSASPSDSQLTAAAAETTRDSQPDDQPGDQLGGEPDGPTIMPPHPEAADTGRTIDQAPDDQPFVSVEASFEVTT